MVYAVFLLGFENVTDLEIAWVFVLPYINNSHNMSLKCFFFKVVLCSFTLFKKQNKRNCILVSEIVNVLTFSQLFSWVVWMKPFSKDDSAFIQYASIAVMTQVEDFQGDVSFLPWNRIFEYRMPGGLNVKPLLPLACGVIQHQGQADRVDRNVYTPQWLVLISTNTSFN